MRLYLDTSVLGAPLDREDARRVHVSRSLLGAISAGEHVAVISNVVQEELEQAPVELRQMILDEIRAIEFDLVLEGEESRTLFSAYEATEVVPSRYRNDLRHVAVATTSLVDALVSWNFRHLVNVRTRRAVHAVNLRLGYPLVDIISPEEI
jgi:predicted nucleic acid-binding protein